MASRQADPLDEQLALFEQMCDRGDPEQAALLERMREHTRRLHQVRGDWNRPSDFRSWNDPRPTGPARPPAEVESFRRYKQELLRDRENQLLLAGGDPATAAAELEGRAAPPALPPPPGP